MGELPSGAVTFCFTDIEGSTRLMQQVGEDAYATLLADHFRLIRDAVAANGGVIVDTEGDGVFAAFQGASNGLAACRDAQLALVGNDDVRVRMGLHTGLAEGARRRTGQSRAGGGSLRSGPDPATDRAGAAERRRTRSGRRAAL